MSESYKHFTLSDRIEIERMLSVCFTLTAIAEKLNFSRQSVMREIMRNRTDEGRAKAYGRHWNGCVHQQRCKLKGVCGWDGCNTRCANCRNVNCVANCKHFKANSCPSLLRPPYVCNGCPEYKRCAYPRLSYHADLADARAKELLVTARKGVDLTEDELALIASITKPLLNNGLSPAAIWTEHGDRLPCSQRSFYRYVNGGNIKGIIRMDLPAAVGYKQRKSKSESVRSSLSKEVLKKRTYSDFLLLSKEVRDKACEMDCVCGLITDSQAILTLFFRKLAFQLMVLLPHKDALTLVFTLDEIETYMARSFPSHVLTDRGSEFAEANAIEDSILLADKRCSLYYCDPRRSNQKARCENAHRLIRRVLPKGSSFEELTDKSVALLCSHINSVPRVSLGGKPPMLQAMKQLPKELFEGYGIELIPTDKIILKPKLLGL